MYINEGAPAIAADALGQMVSEYRAMIAMIDRLSQRYPAEALSKLVDQPTLSVDDLSQIEQVESWVASWQALFDADFKAGQKRYQAHVQHDAERSIYLPAVDVLSHGVAKTYTFDRDFFQSNEYRSIVTIAAKISGLIELSLIHI